MKVIERLRYLVAKSMDARAIICKPVGGGSKRPRTKRDYTLMRAQNRPNTKGASAKKRVPGRRK